MEHEKSIWDSFRYDRRTRLSRANGEAATQLDDVSIIDAARPAGTAVDRPVELIPGPDAPPDGERFFIWDLLQGPEVTFRIEAAHLERDAIDRARASAEKGLPRPDIEPGGPIDTEVSLAQRGGQLFVDWVRRVRARILGAIQHEHERIVAALADYERETFRYGFLITALRLAKQELATAKADDARSAEEAAKAPKRRVAYARRMGLGPFWLLMPLLVFADFVANVPVFNELLPTSPTAEQALRNLEVNASANPLSFGLQSLIGRTLVHLDAAVLAFTVILLLVFLGHQLGSSVRTIVALHGMETAVADELLLRHQRQPKVPAWASALGIFAIVAVLMVARARVEGAATKRFDDAQTELTTVQSQLAQASANNDPTAVQRLDVRRQGLAEDVERLRGRREYSVAIARMNVPIAFLNIVLALCAGLAAYLHQNENLELEPERQPRAGAVRSRYEATRAELDKQRHTVYATETRIATSIARVHHLVECEPLRDSQPKQDRLREILKRFRDENSLARALDQRNIKAFASPQPDPIPTVDLTSGFATPTGFDEAVDRYDRLKAEVATLEGRRDPAMELET